MNEIFFMNRMQNKNYVKSILNHNLGIIKNENFLEITKKNLISNIDNIGSGFVSYIGDDISGYYNTANLNDVLNNVNFDIDINLAITLKDVIVNKKFIFNPLHYNLEIGKKYSLQEIIELTGESLSYVIEAGAIIKVEILKMYLQNPKEFIKNISKITVNLIQDDWLFYDNSLKIIGDKND